MWPLVGWSKPAIRRRQVVLPEPDGPSIAKNSPVGDRERHVVDRAHRAEVARDVLEGDGGDHALRRARPSPRGEGAAKRRMSRCANDCGKRRRIPSPSLRDTLSPGRGLRRVCLSARRGWRCSRTPSGNTARSLASGSRTSPTGVFQKWILSKLPRPLVSQPASVEQRVALAGGEH